MSILIFIQRFLGVGLLLMSVTAPSLMAQGFRGQVNPRTLNLYLPIDHLSLPCYMPIEIKGNYNSYSNDKSLFGEKWTFNHNIRISPENTRFKLMEGDGFENYYTKEKNLEEAKNALVEQIIVAQKKEDSKKGGLKTTNVYDELKQKLLKDPAMREDLEAKLIGRKPLGPGLYYSFSRGPSTLELKADGTFIRTFQNKSFEVFNKDGLITKSSDRNGNYITYTYQDRNVIRINDTCGGSVSFSYQQGKANEGLIAAMRDSLGRELKYDFYPNRRLKSFRNLQNELIEYVYDNVGNLLSLTTTSSKKTPLEKEPKKEVIKFTYNAQYEVEKQIGPDNIETRYSRKFVANNNNHSLTEITKLKNGKTLSREVKEYKTREFEIETKFDGAGKEIKKEIRKISSETGYPTSVLDEKGQGELFVYDANSGAILKRTTVPGGDVFDYKQSPECNLVSNIKMSRGGKVFSDAEFKYDSKCNLISAKETQGGKTVVSISVKWNPQGKISFLSDNIAKKEVAFTFWKFGKAESITLKDVGTLLVKYLPAGDIEKVDTFPHGAGKKRFQSIEPSAANGIILQEVRAALDSMIGYLKPSGVNIGL